MTGSLSVTTAHSMTMKFRRNAEMTERASLSFVQSSELAVEVMDADYRMHYTQSESLRTRLILICENENL